jgi:septal ring factor EnvC (AmiA/AmiB activator)
VNEAVDFLVRSVPVLIGGGLVQFAIFLLRRRAEIRALDVTTSKVQSEAEGVSISSAAQSVNLANLMRDQAERRVGELEEEMEIRATQARLLAQDTARLKNRLARAEADLVILRAVHDRVTEDDQPPQRPS